MASNTAKAAHRGDGGDLRGIDRLGSKISPPNNPNASTSQAPSFALDDRAESDFAYFRARPTARTRNRLPFAGEFSPDVMDQDGLDCFVHAIVERNAAGQPMRRARWLLFCEGGTA
jgi:hypothetical protein